MAWRAYLFARKGRGSRTRNTCGIGRKLLIYGYVKRTKQCYDLWRRGSGLPLVVTNDTVYRRMCVGAGMAMAFQYDAMALWAAIALGERAGERAG